MPPARAPGGRNILVAIAFVASTCVLGPRDAFGDPISWPQPGGTGSPVSISYSFSNLFEIGPLRGVLSEREVRRATAEAFRLWTRHVPLHFLERPDAGPPPADEHYDGGNHPDIRIGAHAIADPLVLAHAYLPIDVARSGLAGDIHLNSLSPFTWGLGDGFPVIDFLEVMAHEIGHAIGIGHLDAARTIMSPFHGFHFSGIGTAFLFPADIAAAQAIYGIGAGSVQPIPEPGTVVLLSAAVLFARHLKRTRKPASPAA